MKTIPYVCALLIQVGGTVALTATAADAPALPHDAKEMRKPSGATEPSGPTGNKPMDESVKPGAPGNLVTTAESTMMRSHDANGDKMVSMEEAGKDPGLKDAFASLDTDRNGKLTEQEFSRYQIKKSAATGAAPLDPPPPAKP